MSFFDDASLVMIPSGYKTSKVYSVKPTDGTGDLAFTRSNDTATRVGPDGLIEKVRTNLALRSQSFATSAVWTTTSGTITDNAGTAPDGTNTASKIVAINTDPYCYQSLTLSGSVVASCYIKGIGSSIGKTGSIRAAGSITNFTITGDWQRVSVAHTAGGAQNYGVETPEIAVVSDEVLLWGFQVEYGDVATPYIATTTAAVSVGPVANVPRLDYLDSSCPRLLLEPQRTNLGLWSEQFNNAGWTNAATTITANYGVSPDGYTNADRFQQTTIGALQQTISVTASTAYTVSFYCKLLGGTSASLGVYNFAASNFIFQDNLFSSLVLNQWVRVTRTFTTPVGCTSITGELWRDSTIDCLVYGFQMEAGAYATSYIPTLGSASTRGNELASKSSINALIGGTSGTIFFEIKTNKTLTSTNYKQFFYYTDASSAQAYMYLNGSNTLVLNPSLGNISSSINLAANTTYKIAVAYATNDFKLYINGVERGSSTSGTSINAVNLLSLGSYQGTSEFNEFVFSQYIHFPTRLSNSDLAALTA